MRSFRFIGLSILTVILALLFVRFPSPPRADLDSAWSMTLLYAHRHGLQFGRDIVFTFGPLGFLISNVYYDGVPLIRFFWEIFGKLAFAGTAMALGVSLGWPRFILFYASMALGSLVAPDLFTAYGIPLLVICWLLPERAKTWQITLAVLWTVIFSAMRLNYCVLALAALAVMCLRDFLRGEWRRALTITASFNFAFLFLWILAGQSIKNLPLYFINGWEISDGYLAAMFVNELSPSAWYLGAALWLIIVAFSVHLFWKGKFATQKWVLLYLLIAWFFMWKHAFTRADQGHISLFFPAVAILLCAAPAGFGEHRRWTFLDLAPAICLFGLGLCRPGYLPLTPGIFLQRLHDASAQVLWPRSFAEQFAAGEKEDERLHGKPDLQVLVGRKSIDVFNFDQDEVLREHLNFHPRPIFQSYSAYTPALLRCNLRFYEKKKAPQVVFARLQTVDGRYPAQDDSLLLEEFPRRYEISLRTGDYLLLRRRRDQPSQPLVRENILQREVSFGEEIALPTSDNCSVEVRAVFRPSVYGRLRSLFAQPTKIKIVLTDSENKEHSGRLIPPMAAAGFLVQPLLETQDDFADFLDGKSAKSVRSIRFEPETANAICWSTINVELFRLPELSLRMAPAQ